MTGRPLILVTNDDGVRSPGLAAAAAAIAPLGEPLLVAPIRQQTSMGHAFPYHPDNGAILPVTVDVDGVPTTAYAVEGSPAITVCHAMLELAPRRPDLCVSGINYGENVGTGITASGTLGAAFQAVALGVPAVAVSIEYDPVLQESDTIVDLDFTAARDFTWRVARHALVDGLPPPVTVLNVNVPSGATRTTPMRATRQSEQSYYVPCKPPTRDLTRPAALGFTVEVDFATLEPGSDIHALKVERAVSVTPLAATMTAPVELPW